MSGLSFLVRSTNSAHSQEDSSDFESLLIADKVVLFEELLAVMTFNKELKSILQDLGDVEC